MVYFGMTYVLGVFKQAAKHARELQNERARSGPKGSLASRRFFKLSLGDSQDPAEAWLFPECIDSGYAAIGFAKGTDFSSCDTQEKVRERYLQSGQGRTLSDYALKAVEFLRLQIQVGDIILISAGNRRVRAIGEVTGPYRYEAREDYEHQRPVDWLWQSEEGLPVETVAKKRFSQQTVYSLSADQLNISAIDELVSPKGEKGRTRNCVLVIDEINRANLAKVFGELITLLESSKRLGGEDEQEVILPYSGESFGVPPNLFVIGTMNTADRSIALMDTALRRRFDFTEMPPQPELLAEDVEGINLRQLLVSMNEKIEELFDRDHLLGHSYLMGVHSVVELSERFQLKIIPLLQEYFFEDWSKLQQVFRDVDAPREQQIIQSAPQSSTTKAGAGRRRLQVNPLLTPAAFSKIYS